MWHLRRTTSAQDESNREPGKPDRTQSCRFDRSSSARRGRDPAGAGSTRDQGADDDVALHGPGGADGAVECTAQPRDGRRDVCRRSTRQARARIPTQVSGLYDVQVPAVGVSALAQQLSANSAVQYAVPPQTFQVATVPNDPSFTNGSQWGLNGTWGINAPTAWNTTTGSNSVIVADVDTGMQLQ